MRRRGPVARFVRPSWNAKRSTCAECGAVEEHAERLLVRLSVCTTCIEEEVRRAHG